MLNVLAITNTSYFSVSFYNSGLRNEKFISKYKDVLEIPEYSDYILAQTVEVKAFQWFRMQSHCCIFNIW